MKGNRRGKIGAIALGVLLLSVGGRSYAQEPVRDSDADAGADAGADADADADADTDAGAGADELHPPHLLDAPAPAYPPGREDQGLHPTVILRITVTAEGGISDVVVEHSAGADFDAEAVQAVKRWVFDPATRGDAPVASRVRVAVHFEPPSAGVPHEGETHEPQEAPHVAPSTPTSNVPADVGPATARSTEDTNAPDQARAEFGTTAEVDREKLRSQSRGAADIA
ncbi:MAG: energy transducer TonB, partial [Polyangiales bacterium]